ncbi:KamA family radical SAM protein [Desulfatitalea alkaliphila]|uniref:KamA family radical SAM protein n=1 Tax=Desulfatitalea alkaliphila TaxID=2929485 RepID=A0AA41R1S0_9BACT|nr:KamA family radical SAM protein [Desulfatitalea alkaliphila]MCJ8500899.1 KamA family radical SAM protein [Desulfatitalea alkaliphila]
MEYILRRDAIDVLRKILSFRNEQLAGYSMLAYMDDLINDQTGKQTAKPSAAFFAELEHLLKGIVGKSGVYDDKTPAYTKYEGVRAARLRSVELSRMARAAATHMEKYTCGLDPETIRRRSRNKLRILKYFNATELEWDQWQWHLRQAVQKADTLRSLVKLSDQEYEALQLANREHIPVGITPYYLSLFDHEVGGLRDRAVRAQVLPSLHYVRRMAEMKARDSQSMDFMLERDTSPIEGITRRYPNVVILKPVLTCPQICVYCQRNWQIEEVHSQQAALAKDKLDKAIAWIADTPEINEVLITGGDPLLLSNSRIESILSRLAANSRIIRIRIGTRTPVTLPQRISEAFVRGVARYHVPGKREIIVVTHFEHVYEITPQAMEAVQKFRRYGMEVYNQLVYTYYNSRRFEAALLRQQLRLIGVTPYYTFNTKGKEETKDFRVPITRLLQEQKEEARLMPGTVRTDEIVFNVPGLGKNYLRASQHRDIISILPDGRRVYEFHPWEKKLALAGTYVYQDVPIYDYLKRLKADGEDPADYRTIWYY